MTGHKSATRLVRAAYLAVAGLAFLSAPALAQKHDHPNPEVVPLGPEYETLSVLWWQWALEQPVTPDNPKTTNPLVDTTGAAAHVGQPIPDDVFFLAGLISFDSGLVAKADRTIEVRKGTRLFFPILNTEEDNVGVDPPLTVAKLRKMAAFGVKQVTSLYTTIDGVALKNLDSYRVVSPVFQYVYPPNHPAKGSVNLLYYVTGGMFKISGSVKPAVADGFYLLLKPLSEGKHTLKFGGTTETLDGNGNPATFELDITYHIHVVP